MLEACPFNENISCGYIEYKLANMNSIIIKILSTYPAFDWYVKRSE